MTRYERTFDTDWETLSAEEAAKRAYAIGVAERLGEDNREHLERVYAEMDSTYEKSMVELAYEEGRNEAADVARETDSRGDVWNSLVEDGPDVDPPESPTRGRDGLPEALDGADILDRTDVDSTEATDRPGFLDR